MKAVPVIARKREGTGKGVARKLRASGVVPGVLYGEQTTPVPLELNRKEISTILRRAGSEHLLVDLTVTGNGGEPQMALVRDVQHDPINGEILHVDFLHISATSRIRITVPVHIVGTAIGVKDFGGILQHTARELEIESLPADIPDKIDVDVSELGIGDAIHVRDIEKEGITFVTALERTIVSVVPPTVIKEVVTAEVTEEAEGEEGAEAKAEGEGEGEGGKEAAEGKTEEKQEDKSK
jgi:large subunit ribosomal protein L25